MSAIIEVKAVHKTFKEVKAVQGISFKVQAGQCFGLLGPNGAGKTTTIEMMEGLQQPTQGEILFQGQPLDKLVYHKLGIQFQHTALQDFLTVAETLNMFAAFYQHTWPLPELINLCQLQDLVDRPHQKLSGGQRQRLLLALALINDPEIIFLDEPTTGLDPHSRRVFWQLIERIKARGKTIILTTHYMDEAQSLCDEIVIVDQGRIIEQGHPEQLLRQHFQGALILLPSTSLTAAQAQQFNGIIRNGSVAIQAQNVDQILKQLLSAGVDLTGLQVKSATLDDLFLKLTGHSLAAESSVDGGSPAVAQEQSDV